MSMYNDHLLSKNKSKMCFILFNSFIHIKVVIQKGMIVTWEKKDDFLSIDICVCFRIHDRCQLWMRFSSLIHLIGYLRRTQDRAHTSVTNNPFNFLISHFFLQTLTDFFIFCQVYFSPLLVFWELWPLHFDHTHLSPIPDSSTTPPPPTHLCIFFIFLFFHNISNRVCFAHIL